MTSRAIEIIDANKSAGGAGQRLRNLIGGSAGNLVEVFDWFAYVTFAIYFSAAIFPGGDQTSQLLKSYVTFAIGFLARPLGAYLMGLYADIKGRRAALVLSVSMMCLGSLVIGLMPTHAQIGLAAPLILTIARIAQGISIGGEYGASAAYVSEVAPAGHRGFWSGMLYTTVIAGQLLAILLQILLQAVLTQQQMYAWGWRAPFIVGGLLAVAVFWLRRGVTESPAFVAGRGGERGGKTKLLLTRYPKEVGVVVMLSAGGGGAFYFYTTYLKDFLINSAAGPLGKGFSPSQAALITLVLLLLFLLLQPLVGALSDRIGRKPVLAAAFGIGALCAYPELMGLMRATSEWQAFLCILPAFVTLSGYTALSAVVKAELFPAHVRALGISAPFALTQAIVGGNMAVVALSLKAAGREPLMFVIVAGLLAFAFLVAITMRDTLRTSLIEGD